MKKSKNIMVGLLAVTLFSSPLMIQNLNATNTVHADNINQSKSNDTQNIDQTSNIMNNPNIELDSNANSNLLNDFFNTDQGITDAQIAALQKETNEFQIPKDSIYSGIIPPHIGVVNNTNDIPLKFYESKDKVLHLSGMNEGLFVNLTFLPSNKEEFINNLTDTSNTNQDNKSTSDLYDAIAGGLNGISFDGDTYPAANNAEGYHSISGLIYLFKSIEIKHANPQISANDLYNQLQDYGKNDGMTIYNLNNVKDNSMLNSFNPDENGTNEAESALNLPNALNQSPINNKNVDMSNYNLSYAAVENGYEDDLDIIKPNAIALINNNLRGIINNNFIENLNIANPITYKNQPVYYHNLMNNMPKLKSITIKGNYIPIKSTDSMLINTPNVTNLILDDKAILGGTNKSNIPNEKWINTDNNQIITTNDFFDYKPHAGNWHLINSNNNSNTNSNTTNTGNTNTNNNSNSNNNSTTNNSNNTGNTNNNSSNADSTNDINNTNSNNNSTTNNFNNTDNNSNNIGNTNNNSSNADSTNNINNTINNTTNNNTNSNNNSTTNNFNNTGNTNNNSSNADSTNNINNTINNTTNNNTNSNNSSTTNNSNNTGNTNNNNSSNADSTNNSSKNHKVDKLEDNKIDKKLKTYIKFSKKGLKKYKKALLKHNIKTNTPVLKIINSQKKNKHNQTEYQFRQIGHKKTFTLLVNNKYVQPAYYMHSDIKNQKSIKIRILKDLYQHSSAKFNIKNHFKKYKKGQIVKIKSLKNYKGLTRFILNNNQVVTSNKYYVQIIKNK